MQNNIISWFHDGEKPRITTFSGVNIILVVTPNKNIINIRVEISVKIIYGVNDWLMEGSVESLSVLAIESYHIFDGEVNVMNVNNRNQ